MSILVVTWNYPPRRGGIESLIHQLCTELSKRQSVFVVTSCEDSNEPSPENIFRAPYRGLLAFGLYALWRGVILLWRNPGIGVVFGGSVLTAPLTLLLGRLFKRKAIVQAHGLDLGYRSLVYQLLCVRWVKYCDRVIANSTYTAWLAKQKGASGTLVSVIPPGVQPERFQLPYVAEASKRKFALEGKRVILFVGRLAKRKGVKEFIQYSLGRITKEIPDACLVVVGDNPADSLTHRDDTIGEIEAAISATGSLSHVRLLGGLPDEDVVGLYQACSVVVLPALDSDNDVEGFGIVLLEAAAAGKPVVATRVGGIPDAVEDGKTGILTEPGDYERLSDAIISLLSNGLMKGVMGEAAMRRVQEKFCWPTIVAQYEVEFGISRSRQN
ncbi:MAG TPA: glycosyltransferase family 4 protein [Candidatus Binatia bacterium]|nr:glycosyltransferase family 4 protein [Candidatus Binatia bacterium]